MCTKVSALVLLQVPQNRLGKSNKEEKISSFVIEVVEKVVVQVVDSAP